MEIPGPNSLAVRTESVFRHYQMGESLVRAVDGISIDIRAGEFVALLGASGSGKSSLLNLVAGLDRPTSGAVIVHGNDLAALSREQLAKYRLHTVGMVFQSFNLIPSMSLLENVELPMRFAEVDRRERSKLARQSLERVGLSGRLKHRPMELSGGEQQRASLARALINHQPSQASSGGRADGQSRQSHRYRNHGTHSQLQSVPGHDCVDGYARAGPR